jgi:hypothetical protein
MNTKQLSGLFGLILFATTGAAFIGGCGDDEPESQPCQEGSFQCVGQELQKCTDGEFVMELMCSEEEPCRAEHGHCHPAGEGGSGHGGHHEGGGHEGGHHMGGGHEGGSHMGGMHMGGAGGA